MGQNARHLDYPYIRHPYLSKSKWIGKLIEVGSCKSCSKFPDVVAQDAEYEGYGGVVNKGKFSRVQLYCTTSGAMCEYSVYDPLEGPTVVNVVSFWNYGSYNREYKQVKVELNTERPDGY